MDDILVRLTYREYMRMMSIVMDADRDGAIDFVSKLIRRVEVSLNSGLKNHLDK